MVLVCGCVNYCCVVVDNHGIIVSHSRWLVVSCLLS